MVCKPSLVVPAQYLWLGVHSRDKRRRSSSGDQGQDEEVETALCRDRIQQALKGIYSAQDYSQAGGCGIRR